MVTVEQLIDQVNYDGLLISNLFQLDDGTWQANVRRNNIYAEFGRGETAIGALSEAISAYKLLLGTAKLPIVHYRPKIRIIRK